MSQVPRELIRQVQICTRSAAGLSDYNPSDPTLPSLPPLSAAIAASDHPSPPHLRCKNCKGMLLRGSESFICVYCGLGPHYDVVPDPISFTSTIGCKWLLRSLGLDGSEMVDPSNKSEQNPGYNSPKSLTRLSDFLSFSIQWPTEIENQETTLPENQSEQSEGSSKLTGVAPDKFFLKSKIFSDTSNDQPFTQGQIGASNGYQDLFQNAHSSEPSYTSSKPELHDAFTGWQADFQAADSQNQHEFSLADSENQHEFTPSDSEKQHEFTSVDSEKQHEFTPVDSENQHEFTPVDSENQHELTLVNSENNFEDPKPFDLENNFGVNLADQIDSVFGPGIDVNDGKKQEDNLAVSSGFDDWNSDDVWNNLSSSSTTVGTKNDTEVSHDDIFQDFHFQTNYADKSEKKPANEEQKTMDEFQGFQSQTNYADSSEKKPMNGEHKTMDVFQGFQSQTNYVDSSEKKPMNEEHKTMDVFQGFQSQTNYADSSEKNPMNEEHKTMDDDLFGEWNDFTGSTGLEFPSQSVWTGGGGDYKVSSSDQNLSEMDLFSFNNKSEIGDFGSFSQPELFSTSISSNHAPAAVNTIVSENSASDWLFDVSGPSHANDGDTSGKSTSEDDAKMLFSQMHDLSFMLETNLCIPSDPDTHKSS